MSYSPQTSKTVILGSSGRLGRMIRPFWRNPHTTWHSRQAIKGYYTLDILEDKTGLVELFKGTQCVLCLAGVTPSSATLSFRQNSMIASACLDAAQIAGVRRVFLTSSAAVYGGRKGLLKETDQLAPLSEYGRSKVEMEKLAMAHGQTSTTLRIGNVAGADAILGNWRPKITIDTFPDGSTPRRSYIGPRTLSEVIQKLTRIEKLPPILNLAAPGSIQMNELLDDANLTYTHKQASENTIPHVTLDTTLLEKYVTFNQDDSLSKSMVTQWKRT